MSVYVAQDLVKLKNDTDRFDEYNAQIKLLSATKNENILEELLEGLSDPKHIANYMPIAQDIVEAIRTNLKKTNDPSMLLFLLELDNKKRSDDEKLEITYSRLFAAASDYHNDLSSMIWLLQEDPYLKDNYKKQNEFHIKLYMAITQDETQNIQHELEKKFPNFMKEYHEYMNSQDKKKNIRNSIAAKKIKRVQSQHSAFDSSNDMFSAIAGNSAYKRDVYETLKQEISDIGEREFEKIFQSTNNIQEQADMVKILVAKKSTSKMFNNTLSGGIVGSMFISGGLGLFIGPFALIPLALGIIVSAVYAKKNKDELQKKIYDIIENDPEFDIFVISMIHKKQHEDESLTDRATNIHNRLFGNANLFLQLAGFVVESVSNGMISPITDALKNLKHMYNANTILRFWFNNPKDALEEANAISFEDSSLLSWSRTNKFANFVGLESLQRSKFNTYLMEHLDEVSEYLKEEIHSQRSQDKNMSNANLVESFMKTSLSFLGIWENNDFKLVHDALYAPNAKSHAKLETLREYYRLQEIRDLLTQYLKNNVAELFPEANNLTAIESLTESQYKKLYTSYLKDRAITNAEEVTKKTGDAVTMTITMIIVGVVIMSPLSPFTPIIFLSTLLAGYAITRIIAKVEAHKMKKIIDTKVSDSYFDKLIVDRAKFRILLDDKFYDGGKKISVNENQTEITKAFNRFTSNEKVEHSIDEHHKYAEDKDKKQNQKTPPHLR